jgi:tetratricopeptide (TPR) repeat protein
MLQIAVSHHQAGRLAEAEIEYRKVLSTQPDHADALHFLGVLAGQTGHPDAAVQLISRSIELSPTSAGAYGNLGKLLAGQGNASGAVAAYRKAAELNRIDPHSWYALGIAHRMNGSLDESLVALRKAIGLHRDFAEAHSEAGSVLKQMGKLDEAISAQRMAIAVNPNLADAHHNLANSLQIIGNSDEAIQEFEIAIRLNPNNALYYANFGDVLCQRDRPAEALAAYERAIGLSPENAKAHSGTAVALADLRRFDEALASHQRAIQLEPENANWHLAFAETHLSRLAISDAEARFQQAIRLQPELGPAWSGLGVAYRSKGKFEEARKCFGKALQIDPNDAVAAGNLATIRNEVSAAEIERLRALLLTSELQVHDRVATGFALGKLLDDIDCFDEAFARYAEANATYRSWRAAEGVRFDANKLSQQTDEMMTTLTSDFFDTRQNWGSKTELPVFIVGMPRSGTTLVEQIVASHSKVFGAGELREIGSYSASLHANWSEAGRWDRKRTDQIAELHLAKLKALGGNAERVVDKMPGNILNLGLIATMYPNARVIFCQRDPRDNCLSCYFQWFAKNNLMFSYDLVDCATQYLAQERIRAHWSKALPLRMLTVQYEELVADLEGQSRRLIDFLGLPWEPDCLEFHKTERTVVTASVWQVRQPIYNSSVGRWRHYEKHLGPLLQALNLDQKVN